MEPNSIELVCRELVELVSDYLNHTLAPTDVARFEKHLLTCPPCTSYLAQMRATLGLAGELDKPTGTADVQQQLVELFRRWHRK